MLAAFIFAAALQMPTEQKLAQRFCQALTSSEIRTFIPIAANEDDLSLDPWFSVRSFFGHNDCIAVTSYRVWREDEWLIVEVDGSATARNAWHDRRMIPVRWYVRVNAEEKIAAVMSELDFATEALLRASNDEARRAVVRRYSEMLPAIARRIADLTPRSDRARTTPATLFLLQWSALIDDPETETYAWCALARVTRLAQETPAAIKLADMARTVARRTTSCEAVAYADFLAANVDDRFARQAELTELVIPLAESLDDPEPALRALHLRAGVDHFRSNNTAAFRRLDTLLDITRRFGRRDLELLALHGLASVLGSIEDRPAPAFELAVAQKLFFDREDLLAYHAKTHDVVEMGGRSCLILARVH